MLLPALGLLAPLLVPFLANVAPLNPVSVDDEVNVAELYAEYHAADDAAALAALWSDHPDQILYTIDADLEGSLKLWEDGADDADQEKIAWLEARAVWGARIATEATGNVIFAEYASAFAGWTDEQKKTFRGGQAAFTKAREEMARGDAGEALKAAVACREAAEPLGDWWGTAMGLSLEGKMLAATERFDEALVPLSRAHLIYDELGLVGANYGVLLDLAASLKSAARWERLLVVADKVAELSGRFDHAEGATMAAELTVEALKELGRDS